MTDDLSKNLTLEALRRAYPERDERDRPDWIAESVDDNGSVRVRPLVWADLISWIERKVEGEVE